MPLDLIKWDTSPNSNSPLKINLIKFDKKRLCLNFQSYSPQFLISVVSLIKLSEPSLKFQIFPLKIKIIIENSPLVLRIYSKWHMMLFEVRFEWINVNITKKYVLDFFIFPHDFKFILVKNSRFSHWKLSWNSHQITDFISEKICSKFGWGSLFSPLISSEIDRK